MVSLLPQYTYIHIHLFILFLYFSNSSWLDSSIDRAHHRYRRGSGFESRLSVKSLLVERRIALICSSCNHFDPDHPSPRVLLFSLSKKGSVFWNKVEHFFLFHSIPMSCSFLKLVIQKIGDSPSNINPHHPTPPLPSLPYSYYSPTS